MREAGGAGSLMESWRDRLRSAEEKFTEKGCRTYGAS